MTGHTETAHRTAVHLTTALLIGACLVGALLLALSAGPPAVSADPIPPDQGGYPKFKTSVKAVTPTLAHTGGELLRYTIEIRNTGACTATDTTLTDVIPDGTTYNDDASASVLSNFSFDDGALTWQGDVGFDSTVVISFSVSVDESFVGTVHNTAVISHPLIAEPVTTTAETVVTDEPILTIEKTSAPLKPGANKPMTYTLTVSNRGQPAHHLDLTVMDHAPPHTSVRDVGPDGHVEGDVVTWTRSATLDLGETTAFTFSVDVSDVPSGTVITNDRYQVASSETDVTSGQPYTVTIVDPIFSLTKHTWPDPPGSNRQMTYTLDLLNQGSLATDLVITDRVPAGVTYVRGGTENGGIVSWAVPRLDTGESTRLTYTVYISDVMGIPIVNDHYGVCSAEDVCQPGEAVTNVVRGPTFEASAALDPIAKKPGSGTGPVTPTLVVRNLGPGSALDARAAITFERIQVPNRGDLEAIPDIGHFDDGPECGEKCRAYVWVGDLNAGDAVTLTTTADKDGSRGRSTIGGEEGTLVTATVSITDSLTNRNTDPVSDAATCKITHLAHLNPVKSAPAVIGRGRIMTYSIGVWNSALATDEPPYPTLWEAVPISGATVLSDRISHGGKIQTVTITSTSGVTASVEAISWTLPAFGTGARIEARTFAVQIDEDLISGTKLVNDLYLARWYESEEITIELSSDEVITLPRWFSNAGPPITTTVKEVGLIDSHKEVTPAVVSPGPGNVLTYFVHIVNSSPLTATGVSVYDYLPWESTTYQRDATASAGDIVSDIVSVQWTGDVGAFSSQVVTLTTLVDEDYQGPVTNTAVITHPDLLHAVEAEAVAYVTHKPVLEISKRASRDQVKRGETLDYTIRVVNRGQKATGLVITDTLPRNTQYVPGSGGSLESGGVLRWTAATLEPGESREFGFAVTVTGSSEQIVNDRYGVRCAEGITAQGEPVITKIGGAGRIYLPLVVRRNE